MSPDFDEPLEDFQDYMPIVSIDARLDPYGVQRIW
jgi:hypothetical protein